MSNASENSAAINKYRDELKAMLSDISEIDVNVLNKSVNAGLGDVKRNTPVDTGNLRRNWKATQTQKSSAGAEKSLENNVDYSIFVNDGHRVVNRKGETVGYVQGKHMLEGAVHVVEGAMEREFNSEVERVNKKHDH